MQKVISIAVYAFLGFCSANNFANASGPDYRSLDIQAPQDITVSSEYVPTVPESFPIVTLPESCQSKFPSSNNTCVYAPEFDLALEQEYWRHVALQDTENMERWIKKTELYITKSQSPNAGRFAMLGIFAHLQIYSKDTKIFDLPNSPRVIKAFQSADKAKELLPRSPNTQAFYWAMRNFRDFALGLNNSGLRAAQHMLDLELTYGERGLAGPVGAVAHLMGSKDKSIVKRGIEEYDSCYDAGICNRDTIIAPYQVIGSRIAQAEGYAYLGDYKKMDASFAEAKRLSMEKHWPMANRIDSYQTDLTKKGGLIEAWKTQSGPGGLRFPLGAAHRIEACAMCHIGNTVPAHYQIKVSRLR